MDSGNTSGSMQSSSGGGGDEEYDSRAAVDGSYMTTNPSSSTSSLLFDPSNFFNHLDHSTMVWPRPVIRSDPIPSDLIAAIAQTQPGSLSTTFPQPAPPVQSQTHLPVNFNIINPTNNNNSSNLASLSAPNAPPSGGGGGGGAVRNPKKRSRASRRAPTTVLTTDTTNFRAMVQEFTGIPAPPFTSSPFPRTRLDLFASGSGSRSGLPIDHHHPGLLRPFAHKLPQATIPPFAVSSNPPALGFNSLLQGPPKFPILPIKSGSNSTVAEDHQFGLAQGLLRNDNNNNHLFATNWVGGGNNSSSNQGISVLNDNNSNTNTNDNNSNNNITIDHEAFLRSISGGFVSTASPSDQVIPPSNGKTTTDFRVSATKTTENNGIGASVVPVARTEGMVESWLCSSD